MESAEKTVSAYTIKSLGPGTWPAFVDLAERHNGVWGGCWCSWFHAEHAESGPGAGGNRALKERLVQEGQGARRARIRRRGRDRVVSVRDTDRAASIYYRKEYEAGLDLIPDYRITCFFVDRQIGSRASRLLHCGEPSTSSHRPAVASSQGKKTTASFFYNGTRALFEDAGFRYQRPKGKNHTVMRTAVEPAS